MQRHTAGIALLSLLLACGCGNDGDPTTDTLYSVAALDGDVTADGVVTVNNERITIGDYSTTAGRRGYVSFDIGGLGTGAKVQSARLRLYLANFNNVPFKSLGGVMADSIDYGTSLSAATYGVAPTATLGKISGATTDWKHWLELDVTATVQQAVNAGTGRAQFRLRHETEVSPDGPTNYTEWSSGESDHKPELVVAYER